MKRLSVLGLCLVASLAFSVLAATGAMAAKVEHGELNLRSSGGPAHLGTPKATITSSSNSGVAHITSAFAGTAVSLFNGVEIEGTGFKCNSAGKTGGVVETFELAEETGWISKAKNEAGVDFKPASGEFLAKFTCEGGIEAKVRASVIGHVTPLNTAGLSTQLNLICDETCHANSPHNFEGGPKDVLLSELSTAPGIESESVQDQENVTVTNHGNSSVCKKKIKKGVETEKCKVAASGELNTLANPARPEFGRCDKKGAGVKYSDPNCTIVAEKGKYGFVPVPG
jgi:hypothetical protein